MGRKSKTTVTEFVDMATGELHSTVVSSVFAIDGEPNYVKLYLQDILRLSDLPKGLNSVLYGLLKYMNYRNEIILNAGLKKEIANDLNLSVFTINKAITTFVKKNVLIRRLNGVFVANPYLFGKGSWKDIKSIRMTIDYLPDGRKFEPIIEFNAN